MWRNKTGRGGRGGFARGKGKSFVRNHERGIQKGDDFRSRNRTEFDDNSQTNRDYNRGFRAQSRKFDVDENRYERSGWNNRDGNYEDMRDPYPDIHSETYNVQDEFQNNAAFREQDDRRNVVEASRGHGEYDNRDNDMYFEKAQRLDDLRNRGQEFRRDDYYSSRETFEFTIDTSDRYDGDRRNDNRNYRFGEPQHRGHDQQPERCDTFRDKRASQHHSVGNRNQPDQRSNFGRDDTSQSARDGRNTSNWKREKFNEKKTLYKTNQEKGSYDDKRQNSRSTDRSGSSKVARSSSSDTRNRESKNKENPKINVSETKRNASDTRNKGRSDTISTHDHKKSKKEKVTKQSESVSSTKNIKTSSREKNKRNEEKTTSDSTMKDKNKQKSDKVNSSSISKKREDRKQSTSRSHADNRSTRADSSSTRVDSSSFKKPGEKHSSRPRSNSGRKLDSDIGHFDDSDILSIMADDDGFERETKAFSSSSEHSRSRNSRERGSQQKDISKSNTSMGKTFERSPRSRERLSNRQQSSKERGSNERHEHSRENYDNSDIRPAFDIKPGTSKFGSGQSTKNYSDLRRQGIIQSNNRALASTKGFRADLKYNQRHKDSRYGGSRITGRSNNNNLIGRSRFSTASKIKDSYLKRKKTFQGITNKRFENRHMSKSYAVNNSHSDLSKQISYGKSEVGLTGAILKDDRIIENRGFANARNTDTGRQGFDIKRENKFNGGFKTYSDTQNVNRNVKGNRFQRQGANFGNRDRFTYRPFKARDVAYQRVKQKYFKGGFGKNRYSRGSRGGYKDYDGQRREEKKNWDRSELDDEIPPDEIENDGPICEIPTEDQAVEVNPQQVIFIPNNDLQSGQPHMVDQFGQIILNPEVGVQQGEEAVPVQYLPHQFQHPDGVSQGEQVVFIPFVNNQGQTDYSGNLPMTYNENADLQDVEKTKPKEKKRSNLGSVKIAPGNKKKPLSRQARAKVRKSLEIKRKQRMEKEIEKKLLKKLLNNPDVNKVVRKSNDAKKKPIIKRISPPSTSYQSKKQYKLIRRGNDIGELDDVSDDETKYDNVSDLEDVSEYEDADEGNDEYDSRQGKRPVFRKPGQPRINKNFSDASRDINVPSTSGDVRRVVESSKSNRQSPTVSQADSMQKFKQSDKGRRSVYIENPKSKAENVMAQKRTSSSSSYETHQFKKRRSISPIEITVSNDKFSERTYRNSGNENDDYVQYDTGNRKERKSNYRPNYSTEDRFERARNERHEEYEKGNKDMYNADRERQTQRQTDKTNNRILERSGRNDKYRNERNLSKNDADDRRREVDERDKGKYSDNKGYRKDEDWVDSRSRKNENYKEHSQDKFDDRYNESPSRRRDNAWQGRNDRTDRRKEKNRENDTNERKKSSSGDRSLSDDRNSGCSNQRYERDRADDLDLGTNRNIQGNNFVSHFNQSQYQMNQPMMQQSQPFISAQSPSIPLQGQSVMQFSSSGSSVDHSLPPVQNSPISMPPFPPPGMGLRPDMSLPPPLMNVGGTPNSMGTMVLQHQANSVQQFQPQPMQQVNMQQQAVQQQHIQNVQPQFQQQQQYQQMQTQPQMIQQQTNSNFQTHQPAFQTNIQSNQQMSLQSMQTGQYQQPQSGVNMVPVNHNQQAGSISQGQRGSNQQGIPTSGTFPQYVATTSHPHTVRGVLGTIKKQSVDSSTMRRGQQVRTSASQTQVSNSQTMSRRQGNRNQSNISPSRGFNSYGHREDDNDVDDDEYLEMLCSKCDKVFLSREVMRRHGRWHDKVESNTKSWRCDQCEQGFSSSLGHSDHMSSKHSIDSWNCSLCDMTFSNSNGLSRHVRHASHKDMKVKFVCSQCPASFMVLTQLIQHKKENLQFNAGYSGLRKY